jgi:hypothetical protein
MGLLLQLGSRVVRPVDCELIQSRVDAYAEGLVHRRRCRCWDLNCVRVGEMIPIAILMLDVCDVSAPRGSYKSHLIERRRSGKSWIELPFLPLQVAGKKFCRKHFELMRCACSQESSRWGNWVAHKT